MALPTFEARWGMHGPTPVFLSRFFRTACSLSVLEILQRRAACAGNLVLTAATLCGLFLTGDAAAQESRCADCHFSNGSTAWSHLSQWDLSRHGRNDVGCESCHGGDASTFDIRKAHDGIRNGSHPASPTNYLNLPKTCGACHQEALEAFRKSRHFELLEEGQMDAPSCSTCHTDVGAFTLSSRGLERTCKSCHGERKWEPAPERPRIARSLHADLVEVKKLARSARRLIRKVKPAERRAQLELELQAVETPLHEAIAAAHSFNFDGATERAGVARERIDRLLEKLVQSP